MRKSLILYKFGFLHIMLGVYFFGGGGGGGGGGGEGGGRKGAVIMRIFMES